MKKLFLCLFFLPVLIGCITDFAPEVEGVQGILVVDGMITSGESVFRLSRSVGINELLRDKEMITNAVMYVERSDGMIFNATHEGEGAYHINTGDLSPSLEYRLCFSIGDRQYQSSFLKPIQTVEIDNLSFRKEGWRAPVEIYVTSNGGKESPIYYRWSYRETWEVKATLKATHYYENGKLTELDLRTPYNSYYCWGRDSSKSLLLGTTKELTENIISNKKLYEVPCTNDKVSILYHVEVSQMQLREEAYNYYRFMQDEIERTGGLFNLVMSAGDNGNIYSLSDPDETMIGYVEVTNVTKKGMYIPWDDVYEDAGEHCEVFIVRNEFVDLPWLDYFSTPKTYSTWRCVDCRMRYNATKNKPSWWPTDHL